MAHFYAIWGANFFETFCDTFILPKTSHVYALLAARVEQHTVTVQPGDSVLHPAIFTVLCDLLPILKFILCHFPSFPERKKAADLIFQIRRSKRILHCLLHLLRWVAFK